MNMIFEHVRDALVDLFGSKQGTAWNTIGFIERDQSAAENNSKRTVQVYYNSGDFPKGSSSPSGPVQHNMTFNLILTVSEKSTGDLVALSAAETAEEYAAALATFSRSEFLADRSMDEFIRLIFSVLMDPQNRNLGLPATVGLRKIPNIGNRWVPTVRKEQPNTKGEFCTMRAMITLTGLVPEDLLGFDVAAYPEWSEIPYSGSVPIKGNPAQSGNEAPGTIVP